MQTNCTVEKGQLKVNYQKKCKLNAARLLPSHHSLHAWGKEGSLKFIQNWLCCSFLLFLLNRIELSFVMNISQNGAKILCYNSNNIASITISIINLYFHYKDEIIFCFYELFFKTYHNNWYILRDPHLPTVAYISKIQNINLYPE